jgi:hypothetical protein
MTLQFGSKVRSPRRCDILRSCDLGTEQDAMQMRQMGQFCAVVSEMKFE